MSLEEAYQQARTLEQAQKQSASYDNSIVAGTEQQDIKNQSAIAATLGSPQNQRNKRAMLFLWQREASTYKLPSS